MPRVEPTRLAADRKHVACSRQFFPETLHPKPLVAGQKSKLTPQVIVEVKRLLPTVLHLETVADYLNVARSTWRRWLRRGRKEAQRLDEHPQSRPRASEALYLEFYHTFQKALAEGEFYDAAIIKAAAKDQWRAAAWRLERRFPERWASKDKTPRRGKDQTGQPHPQHAASQRGPVVVIQDDEWYGNNAHDLAASRLAAPEARPALPGATQGGSVRAKVGQDGPGADGHH
jgi:hypothetical protein